MRCFCCATASAAGRPTANPSSAMVVSMSVRRRFMMCLVNDQIARSRERKHAVNFQWIFRYRKKDRRLRACQPMAVLLPVPGVKFPRGPRPQGQDVNYATPSGGTVKRRLSKRPDIPPAPGEIACRGSWRDAANGTSTPTSFCTNSKPPAQGCSRRITIVSLRPRTGHSPVG
jgi:hypothetical protein